MSCKRFHVVVILTLIAVSLIYAQEEKALEISDMKFCTDIQNREPVGIDTIFPDTIEGVYCFTLVEGATDTTSIAHIWYYNDEQMAEVSLSVASPRWRTWSSKKIMKEWTGRWRVEVVVADSVVRSEEFSIKD